MLKPPKTTVKSHSIPELIIMSQFYPIFDCYKLNFYNIPYIYHLYSQYKLNFYDNPCKGRLSQ